MDSSLANWPVLAIAVAIAFAIQWIAFIPAWYLQTERHFDLIGSLTYISVTAFRVGSGGERRAGAVSGLEAGFEIEVPLALSERLSVRGSQRGVGLPGTPARWPHGQGSPSS